MADGQLLANAKFIFLRDTDSMRAVQARGITGPQIGFGPDATFAIDLRDDDAAAKLLSEHKMEPGRFLCAIPRLRWTPYWEIHPETTAPNPGRIRVNEEFAEKDHAKLREGITAWVRETKMRVLLNQEATRRKCRFSWLHESQTEHCTGAADIARHSSMTAQTACESPRSG